MTWVSNSAIWNIFTAIIKIISEFPRLLSCHITFDALRCHTVGTGILRKLLWCKIRYAIYGVLGLVENSWHLNSGIAGIFILACARHIAYRGVNLYSTGHVEVCGYLVRTATVRISAVIFLTEINSRGIVNIWLDDFVNSWQCVVRCALWVGVVVLFILAEFYFIGLAVL
jgi:hypothetical protein